MSPHPAECLTLQADTKQSATLLVSAKNARLRAISRPNGNFSWLGAVGIVLATLLTPANAYFDQGICCMLKVREEITLFQDNPWSICDTDHAYVYLSPGPYQSVNATMGWCQQNCGGYQVSSSDEWLRPLATWILPTIAFLLLCPVGESEDQEEQSEDNDNKPSWWDKIRSWTRWVDYFMQDPVVGFRYKAQEYIALLGDPASAICGGFSEIVTDARILRLKPRHWFDQAMVGVSTLVGSTRFDKTALQSTLLTIEKNVRTTSDHKTSAVISYAATDTQLGSPHDQDIQVIKKMLENKPAVKTLLHSGIMVMLKARIDFVNAVFLPVILLFATTVSSFHDAYDENGDVETAHNLSYGIWYSWVIILAVVSNSYAASVNPGVAQAALPELFDLTAPVLPLRKRFPNAMMWGNWVKQLCNGAEDAYFVSYFYPTYIGGQLFGWACVAFACACASAISYTTPTIGVGCDTFTYLLYGGLSFVLALLMVLRHWVASQVTKGLESKKVLPVRKGSLAEEGSHEKELSHNAWKIVGNVLKIIYALLVSLNAFVLFGSTLFHLIGLYRNCRCQALFGSSSAILELNFFTQKAIDNASAFWLPVGYVCFSFVWVICMVAIVLRAYLYHCFNSPSGYSLTDEAIPETAEAR